MTNQLVVLDGHVLVYCAADGMTNQEAERLVLQFKEQVVGYRVLVVNGPTEVLDFRGDDELASLAERLLEKIGMAA